MFLVAMVAAVSIGFVCGMLAMVRRQPRPLRRCMVCKVNLPAQCPPGTGCEAPTARGRHALRTVGRT